MFKKIDYAHEVRTIEQSEKCCCNCNMFVKYKNAVGGRCGFSMTKSVLRTDFCVYFIDRNSL